MEYETKNSVEMNPEELALYYQITAYLKKVVHTARRDYVNGLERRKSKECSYEELAAFLVLEEAECSRELESILEQQVLSQRYEKLTHGEKAVLRSIYGKQLTLKQIAIQMGISTGRAGQLKQSALKKLKKLYEEDL